MDNVIAFLYIYGIGNSYVPGGPRAAYDAGRRVSALCMRGTSVHEFLMAHCKKYRDRHE